MPDLFLGALIVVALLLLADLAFAGGGMTMTGMSAVAGAMGHPLVLVALAILAFVLGGLLLGRLA